MWQIWIVSLDCFGAGFMGVKPVRTQKSSLFAYICIHVCRMWIFCMRLGQNVFFAWNWVTFWKIVGNFLSHFKAFTLKIKAQYCSYHQLYSIDGINDQSKQECIPVGCVLSTGVAVSRGAVPGPGGLYLVPGGVHGPGGVPGQVLPPLWTDRRL